MKIGWIFLVVVVASLLAGCGTLMPKKVELWQDRVRAFPLPTAKDKELQRKAAAMAADKAKETLAAALGVEAPVEVVAPAKDTVELTEAVSLSVGPPLSKAADAATNVAARLETAVAKLGARVDKFKEGNDENAGKRIEGTGLFQIPYFLWIALVAAAGFVGLLVVGVIWSFVKMYALSNPPVQLGVSAVQLGAGFLKRALSETVKGGERFKEEITAHVKDPATLTAVKAAFRSAQEKAQSVDTQDLIKVMTAKE